MSASRPLATVLAAALAALAPLCGQAPGTGRAVAVKPAFQPALVQESRVALVIGNASYREMPLQNPVNDARAMATKLGELGFEVVLRENVQQKQIGTTLRAFRSRLAPGCVAVFFYAGHGFQVDGVNYLPTVDADIASEDDAPTQCIDLGKVLEMMESQKTRLNLVFLDACRNNPFTHGFRSVGGGLAKITPPSGTILSFATRPGSVAADGSGAHGLYTQFLLATMDRQGVPIEQVLKEVFAGVKRASHGRQEPWVEGGIEGDFFFRPPLAGGSVPAAVAGPSMAVELAFWDSIKASRDPRDYRAYLKTYPSGQFADLAGNRLKALAPETSPAPASLSTSVQNPLGMTFAAIPAGTFTMGDNSGDPSERPEHQVRISRPFHLQTTPVTVKQWKAFADAKGYRTEAERDGGIWSDKLRNPTTPPNPVFLRLTWRDPGYFRQEPDHPAVCISWKDAQAFLDWLNQVDPGRGYRLPTEAEWEYACLAGSRGEPSGRLDEVAWYADNSGKATHPVGMKAANAWGLYDMLGNACQWCQDWYWDTYYGMSPLADPQGPSSGAFHSARGGDCDYSAARVRPGNRIWSERKFDLQKVGFRVVMTEP